MNDHLFHCIQILRRSSNITQARDQQTLADFLAKISTFQGMCSKAELNEKLVELSMYLEFQEVEEGTTLFHKGEVNFYFYVILLGGVATYGPKSAVDIQFEEKCSMNIQKLQEDLFELMSVTNNQKIRDKQEALLNQINKGKNIQANLKNVEDEQFLKVSNKNRYFRGETCIYKKTQQMRENESFGESILSSSDSQCTSTLIANQGVLFSHDEELERQDSKKEESSNLIQNKPKKVIFLAKVKKQNFLKVFSSELQKRSFIRSCLLGNYRNDINDKELDALTFQFKEEHLEKGIHLIKQIDPHIVDFQIEQDSKVTMINSKSGIITEGLEKKTENDADKPNLLLNTSETEFLYLLYKGSIEVMQKIITTSKKSQVKNLESHILKEQVVTYTNKVNIRISHLAEGEFFGHENWFKEVFHKEMENLEEHASLEQDKKEKQVEAKKDFSMVVKEIDTVIFKISRNFICQEQNLQFLHSLIKHGKRRHGRYMQISKENSCKAENSLQKQIKQQSDYFTQEKNNKLVEEGILPPPIFIPSSQLQIPSDQVRRQLFEKIRKEAPKIKEVSKKQENNNISKNNNKSDNGSGECNDLSPSKKKKLQPSFDTFSKNVESNQNIQTDNPKVKLIQENDKQCGLLESQNIKRQPRTSPLKKFRDQSISPLKTLERVAQIQGIAPSSNNNNSNDDMSPIKREADRSDSPLKKQITDRSIFFLKDEPSDSEFYSPFRKTNSVRKMSENLEQTSQIEHSKEMKEDDVTQTDLNTQHKSSFQQIKEFRVSSHQLANSQVLGYQNLDCHSPKKLQKNSSMGCIEDLNISTKYSLKFKKQESCAHQGDSPGQMRESIRMSSPRKSSHFPNDKQFQQTQSSEQSENDKFMLPNLSSFFVEPFTETKKKVAFYAEQQKLGGLSSRLKHSDFDQSGSKVDESIIPKPVNNDKTENEYERAIQNNKQIIEPHTHQQFSQNEQEIQLQQQIKSKLKFFTLQLTKARYKPLPIKSDEKCIPLLINTFYQSHKNSMTQRSRREINIHTNKLSASLSQPHLQQTNKQLLKKQEISSINNLESKLPLSRTDSLEKKSQKRIIHNQVRSLINLNKVQPIEENTPLADQQDQSKDSISQLDCHLQSSQKKLLNHNLSSQNSASFFTQKIIKSLSSNKKESTLYSLAENNTQLIRTEKNENFKIKPHMTSDNFNKVNIKSEHTPIKSSSSTALSSKSIKGSQLYFINEAKKQQFKKEYFKKQMDSLSDMSNLQQSTEMISAKQKKQTEEIHCHDAHRPSLLKFKSIQFQGSAYQNYNLLGQGLKTFHNTESTNNQQRQLSTSNGSRSPPNSKGISQPRSSILSVSPTAKLRKGHSNLGNLQVASPKIQDQGSSQHFVQGTPNIQLQIQALPIQPPPLSQQTVTNFQSSGNITSPKMVQFIKPNFQYDQILNQISSDKQSEEFIDSHYLINPENKGFSTERSSLKRIASQSYRPLQSIDQVEQSSSISFLYDEFTSRYSQNFFNQTRSNVNLKKMYKKGQHLESSSQSQSQLHNNLMQNCFKKK